MNILVISSNLIGDNILSTGIIKDFIERYPDSKLTIIVGPTAAQIYKNFPNILSNNCATVILLGNACGLIIISGTIPSFVYGIFS